MPPMSLIHQADPACSARQVGAWRRRLAGVGALAVVSVAAFAAQGLLSGHPFCTLTYGVKFPMFEKSHVVGTDASGLYKGLAAAAGEAPKWNFHKYLVGRDGRLVGRHGSQTRP